MYTDILHTIFKTYFLPSLVTGISKVLPIPNCTTSPYKKKYILAQLSNYFTKKLLNIKTMFCILCTVPDSGEDWWCCTIFLALYKQGRGLDIKGTVSREKSEAQMLKEQCSEKEFFFLLPRGERWDGANSHQKLV